MGETVRSTPAQLVAALRDLAHDFDAVKSLTQATSALYFDSPSRMLRASARTLEEHAMAPYGMLEYWNRPPVVATDAEWAERLQELRQLVEDRQLSPTTAQIATVELLQRLAEITARLGESHGESCSVCLAPYPAPTALAESVECGGCGYTRPAATPKGGANADS